MAAKKFGLAFIQMAVGACKKDNVQRAASLVSKATSRPGVKVVVLPECCNSPYGNDFFPSYAEPIPGETTQAFSDVARQHQIYLIAGSIPEREDEKLYNTCTVYNPEGSLILKHRKVHLFDIDVPGKISFQESKTLSPGSSLSMFETPFAKIGVGICYDLRFAEMAQLYARKGCHLVVYPAAFNTTTGAAHWELLMRARAVDNQMYVGAISPARDSTAGYVAWGHSTLINPWGEIVCKAEIDEEIIYGDVDLDYLEQIRQQIPITKQRREDLYDVVDCTQREK